MGAGDAQGRPAGRAERRLHAATAAQLRAGPADRGRVDGRVPRRRAGPPARARGGGDVAGAADGGAARRRHGASRDGAGGRRPRSLQDAVTSVTWELAAPAGTDVAAVAARLLAAAELPLERVRKGQRARDDVRPQILDLVPAGRRTLRAELSTTGRGLRPAELAALAFPDAEPTAVRALRTHQWIEHDGTRREVMTLDDIVPATSRRPRRCARRSGRRMRKEHHGRDRDRGRRPRRAPHHARPTRSRRLTAARTRARRATATTAPPAATARPASAAAARAAVSVDASRARRADGAANRAATGTSRRRPPRAARAAARGTAVGRGGRAGARAQAADRRHPSGAGRGPGGDAADPAGAGRGRRLVVAPQRSRTQPQRGQAGPRRRRRHVRTQGRRPAQAGHPQPQGARLRGGHPRRPHRAAPRARAQGPAGRPLPDVRAGAREHGPGGGARGSQPDRALRLPTGRRHQPDPREHLRRPGAERPAGHGGGVRRHRHAQERRALPRRRAVRRRGHRGEGRPGPHRGHPAGPPADRLPGDQEPDRGQGRPPHPGGLAARTLRRPDPQLQDLRHLQAPARRRAQAPARRSSTGSSRPSTG